MLEKFLAKLTLNAAIIALLVAALVVQTVRIEGFKIWPISVKGYRAEANNLRDTIKDLQDKSKQKQIEVREVIKEGKTRIVTVEKQAKAIEAAPLPGNCQTPREVLSADI